MLPDEAMSGSSSHGESDGYRMPGSASGSLSSIPATCKVQICPHSRQKANPTVIECPDQLPDRCQGFQEHAKCRFAPARDKRRTRRLSNARISFRIAVKDSSNMQSADLPTLATKGEPRCAPGPRGWHAETE